MNSKHVLVSWHDNWADEMDLYSTHVMTRTAWNEFEALVRDSEMRIEAYFGTNESNDYGNPSAILNCFDTSPLSVLEVEILESTGACSGGWGEGVIEQVYEKYHDMLDEEAHCVWMEAYGQFPETLKKERKPIVNAINALVKERYSARSLARKEAAADGGYMAGWNAEQEWDSTDDGIIHAAHSDLAIKVLYDFDILHSLPLDREEIPYAQN